MFQPFVGVDGALFRSDIVTPLGVGVTAVGDSSCDSAERSVVGVSDVFPLLSAI